MALRLWKCTQKHVVYQVPVHLWWPFVLLSRKYLLVSCSLVPSIHVLYIFQHLAEFLKLFQLFLSSTLWVAQNFRGKTVDPVTVVWSSLLAGESWNRYHNALSSPSIFQSVAWHPVQKAA